jgi:hypothetical protein
MILAPAELATAFTRPPPESESLGADQLRSPYYRPVQVILISAIDAAAGDSPRAFRLASWSLAAALLVLFACLVTWLSGSAAAGRSGYVSPIGVIELECQIKLAQGRYAETLAFVSEQEARDTRLASLPPLQRCAGRAMLGLGQREEGVALLEASVANQSGPTPAKLALLLARANAEAGNPERALEWLTRAEAARDWTPALAPESARIRGLTQAR